VERYEYWMVKAPNRKIKVRGKSKADDGFALTVMETMNKLGRDGWQFLRTETLVEDRRSFLGRALRHQHSYMVYRRPLRSGGMSLSDPVAPARMRDVQPPNIEMLRERITQVMSDPNPVVALRR